MLARRLTPLALMAVIAAGVAAPASAAQQSKAGDGGARQCFRAQDWRGTRALNEREAYIRVNQRDIWKLQFKDGCPAARGGGDLTIGNLVQGGTNQICSPVDLMLQVAPRGSPNSTPCIVESMTRLSPGEIAGLPRGVLP